LKLDIRIPLGLLFLIFGVLLTVFGASSNPALYDRSLHVNVNLWWGTVMLVFGLTMYVLGRRSHRRLEKAAVPAGSKSASENP
jgi:hypothetical protein